jgi:hypothetical protein
MHEGRTIPSPRDFHELQRMLAEAITRGYVEQVPVIKPNRYVPNETWYRDKETGRVAYL